MSEAKQRPKAATLAVGTEVTDGQILDRNSAWISQKLVAAGVQMIEHRAVADDHADIERALVELSERADLLFVTGGLGPTSDDFTRELLAKVFSRPLEYDETSWDQIVEKLGARGITAREIQKQQCYYPKGSRVLFNPAGTANAFAFDSRLGGRSVGVYALPGPPVEIAAVWEQNLKTEIESLTPMELREELYIVRTLGRGESDVAEMTEGAIAGSGLRVGYRAHAPYVEVKLWYTKAEIEKARPVIDKVESILKPWIINRNDEDVADHLVDSAASGTMIHIRDSATSGALQERLSARIRERKLVDSPLSLVIETNLAAGLVIQHEAEAKVELTIEAVDQTNLWVLRLKTVGKPETVLEVKPPFNYKVRSERGRKYITEKALVFVQNTL